MLVEASEEARLWLAMLPEVVVDLRREMMKNAGKLGGVEPSTLLERRVGSTEGGSRAGKRASERAILRDTWDRLVVPEGL